MLLIHQLLNLLLAIPNNKGIAKQPPNFGALW
jgi:hypothetical protein